MDQAIVQALDRGVEIIIPAERLVRHLRYRYAKLQLDRGLSAWETPVVLTWSQWCEREWRSLSMDRSTPPILINRVQQQWIWQRIIHRSGLAGHSMHLHDTAILAMQSHAVAGEALLLDVGDDHGLNKDTFAFNQWRVAYQDYLNRHHLIDPAGLPAQIIAQLPVSPKGREILFYGFHTLTAQQEEMIQALRQVQISVDTLGPGQRNKVIKVHAFPGPGREIRQLAGWAKATLSKAPGATIGILFADLSAQQVLIRNELDRVLHPRNLLQFEPQEAPAYSIALGKCLGDYPLVHTAICLLGLGRSALQVDRLSELLHSPYIAGAGQEYRERALFDQILQQYGGLSLSLKGLLRLRQAADQASSCPRIFFERLEALYRFFPQLPDRQSLSAWCTSFSACLHRLGWPGERQLNSDEFQLIEAWQAALQTLSSLDQLSEPTSYETALSYLNTLVEGQHFQPETAETPIQVMGINGAAGMQFDYLWIGGMHDRNWPAPARPNPFLPLALQKQAGLAQATAAGQYDQACRVLGQLTQSACEVRLSYALQDAQQTFRPSPLILSLGEIETEPTEWPLEDYREILFHSRDRDAFVDAPVPLGIGNDQTIPGGTAILQDQAACPFRAFARHRLHARGIARQAIGLDPSQRGLLVHDLLRLIWQALRTSSRLQACQGQALDQLIDEQISLVIRRAASLGSATLAERFWELERRRLHALMKEWLALEKKRAPFTVLATEKKQCADLGSLSIHMRVDRIDRLASGDLAIIDYKTGQASPHYWEGERPDEPQLPIYAVFSPEPVAAVLFAKLRPNETQFMGIAHGVGQFPSVSTLSQQALAQRIAQWQVVLSRLAREFCAGHVLVQPKGKQTCRTCDLQPLCRKDELV